MGLCGFANGWARWGGTDSCIFLGGLAGYGVVGLVLMVGRVRGGAGSSVGGEQTVGAGQTETMREGIKSLLF